MANRIYDSEFGDGRLESAIPGLEFFLPSRGKGGGASIRLFSYSDWDDIQERWEDIPLDERGLGFDLMAGNFQSLFSLTIGSFVKTG